MLLQTSSPSVAWRKVPISVDHVSYKGRQDRGSVAQYTLNRCWWTVVGLVAASAAASKSTTVASSEPASATTITATTATAE